MKNAPVPTKSEIVVFDRGSQLWTTSVDLAEKFGKRHADVLRAIELLGCSEEFNQRNFASISYDDSYGRTQPAYEITRDGFAILVMGFTGKRAMAWKEKYIAAFNAMEAKLLELADHKRRMGNPMLNAGNEYTLRDKMMNWVLNQTDPMCPADLVRSLGVSAAYATATLRDFARHCIIEKNNRGYYVLTEKAAALNPAPPPVQARSLECLGDGERSMSNIGRDGMGASKSSVPWWLPLDRPEPVSFDPLEVGRKSKALPGGMRDAIGRVVAVSDQIISMN